LDHRAKLATVSDPSLNPVEAKGCQV